MAKVKSIRDLFRHITLHRRRVYALGIAYGGDDSLGLKLVLWAHDLEKYLFLPTLWRYYAKGGGPEARAFYDHMNEVGKRLQAPLKAILDPELYQRYSEVERIADVVDRHADPVALEEFGLKKRRPLKDFLQPRQLCFAGPLLKRYKQITKGLEY